MARNRSLLRARMVKESIELDQTVVCGNKNRHNIRNRMWKKHRIYQEMLFRSLREFAYASGKDKDKIAVGVSQILLKTLMNLKKLESMYLTEYCVDSFDDGPKNITRRRNEIKRECAKRKFRISILFDFIEM